MSIEDAEFTTKKNQAITKVISIFIEKQAAEKALETTLDVLNDYKASELDSLDKTKKEFAEVFFLTQDMSPEIDECNVKLSLIEKMTDDVIRVSTETIKKHNTRFEREYKKLLMDYGDEAKEILDLALVTKSN